MTYADRETDFVVDAVNVPFTADESTLVLRAQRRDPRAFERLYRTHVARIHATCLRIAANRHRAEELTQRTFITAWNELPRFRGESAFASWLHRVAVNTVLAELRAEQRRTRRIVAMDDAVLNALPDLVAVPGTHLDLEHAIATLPPQARAIFVLHDVEGYHHDEIAEFLSITVGTTKAQLHRARHLLQQALQ